MIYTLLKTIMSSNISEYLVLLHLICNSASVAYPLSMLHVNHSTSWNAAWSLLFNFGLQYNKKYYYKVGTGEYAREFWFMTPPAHGLDTPYTFGLIGEYTCTQSSK